MNFSITETKWVKFGKSHDFVFVGNETIATASGIYVSFLNLNTRERRIERFEGKERGDGASCLAGHPTVSMFSVIERRSNPKISVFMYPSLEKVSKCTMSGRINGYLSCFFAGTEYLVSLTSFPDFQLIVWLWRTGKHVAVLNTKINDLVQEISCSPNPPYLISQRGVTDGALAIYQIHTCSKLVSVNHVNAPIPERRVVSSSWTPEGNLFVSDELGNVCLVVIDACKVYSVVKSEKHEPLKDKPIVVAYKSGVIVANADNEIAYYRKSSTDWSVSWKLAWSVSSPYSILIAKQHCSKDGILFHSRSGEIFKITQYDNVPHIEFLYTDEIEYKMLFPISQRADHVAVVDRLNRLCIFELLTGKLTKKLSLKHHGEVSHVDSHPMLPMLASCSVGGNCIFIDITSVSSPKIFNCFHLYGDSLDRIKFSRCGKLLGVANSRSGKIFIVGKRFERKHTDVLGFIEIDGFLTDFLIYEKNNDRFEILVLATTNPSIFSIGGDKMIMYTCEISINFYVRATCVINLTRPFKMLYRSLNKPLGIFGIPSLSKQLHQMEIQNDFQDIALTEALFSLHQMRNIGIHATDSRIITYGYDGLIIIRDSTELCKVIAIFMPHHRSNGGVKCAISSRFGETVVSLGRNGDLVATRVRLPEARANLVETKTVHSSIEDFASNPDKLYDLGKETWLVSIMAVKLKAEQDEALPLRALILADLGRIKKQICELLDVNECKVPDARLPISTFDLDRESRRRKLEEARLERDEMRRNLEEESARRDRISSDLLEIFWKPLQVKPSILRSIDGDTVIRNYLLVESTRRTNDYKVWDKLSSDADEFLYSYEIYNESVNERNNSGQESVEISDQDVSTTNSNGTEGHEMIKKWYTLVDEDEKSCISGITTHQWIEDESVASTHQLLISRNSDLETILKKDTIIENRERKLKMHFNNLFDEMRRSKECELKRAKERIERLRYCVSELKTMFGIDSILEPIEIPTWNVEEMPDYIITVKDHEVFEKQSRRGKFVTVTIDENQEDERENGRNDFYRKTLEKMMDGVLEPKWEDEVKKEVPVPDCMMTKDPTKYTDEDITVIASYKSKVQALQKEREKYKTKLQTEIIETKDALQRDIATFNERLKDLELKKMQIECAILQERLMRIRAIRRHRRDADGRREIARLVDDELAPAMHEARRLAEVCGSHDVVVSELKARYDNLCKTEKRQEAKFRGEFTDLKQPMVEHLFRYYKRRPKIGQLTTTSITYLTEVTRCVAAKERSDVLPRECQDFLKGMESLDAMPRNLPSQINVNHWQTMCKLRRAKIEVETKVRCCAMEMIEAEQTLTFYQKAMQSADNVVACKKVSLDETERSLARLAEEMEIQLILKMGQIEIPLRACPSDYAFTVLATRDELSRVNDCIRETGRSKLAAMHKSVHLRKVVSQYEWQHTCAKMVLEDLRQELKDIREFKITRNVLESLSRCSHGVNLEKDYERMQVNLQIFRNRFRELLKVEQTRLKETKLLMAKWKRKNDKISKEFKSKSLDIEERRETLDDSRRKRSEECRRMRLAAIARRTKLVMKAEENYEQLLILHAQLEVLKLRTYPTLQFKVA